MIVYESLGQPKTHRKIVPGNTATGISVEGYTYIEREISFSNGTAPVVAGAWVVGATSAAKAEIVSVNIVSGTLAGGDASGSLRIKNQHGTFQSENVNIAGNATALVFARNSNLYDGDYDMKGMLAKSAVVSVTANTQLMTFGGAGTPDQTSLVGHSMLAGSSTVITDINAIKGFRTIDYTAGSAGTVNITLYF